MPRGDKSSYTNKQKRQAEHIEEGYEKRGVPEKEAEKRAWATVNKQSGGGKLSGSGRGKKETTTSAQKGGEKSQASRTPADRSRAAKKAAETRAKNAAPMAAKKTAAPGAKKTAAKAGAKKAAPMSAKKTAAPQKQSTTQKRAA